ncbi:MAG: sulfite exporter TauE/SafE family protein [Bacteroidales bacterium]|nr:sulfite exporter TauE/SafE family protein [Bacteroidales bacterium]
MNLLLLSIHPNLSPGFLILFLLVAVLLGMAKAGLSGLGLAIIPIMALIFGAKESTGVILPMLIAADIMAVTYWHRHAVWKHIIKILPWVAIGIGIALFVGNSINDNQFRIVMLSVVWIMLILMIVNDLWKKESEVIPHNMVFGSGYGTCGWICYNDRQFGRTGFYTLFSCHEAPEKRVHRNQCLVILHYEYRETASAGNCLEKYINRFTDSGINLYSIYCSWDFSRNKNSKSVF